MNIDQLTMVNHQLKSQTNGMTFQNSEGNLMNVDLSGG